VTLKSSKGAMENGLIPFMNKLASVHSPDEKGNYTSGQKIRRVRRSGHLLVALSVAPLGFSAWEPV